ncbi:histidine kinase [Undibacterium sp. Jales W-56]|uniref:sensor histidine kinase n=1 Tax=Undibacterium sp. Jales W-56 TaxID=2897325 RepID=UPI0021D3D598|nr:histidine kinase [Undibacterium sp. Jales W-56]MCU6435603.1 histidine kinase [Undibacterium sp. Jales W-56]
MFPLFFPRDNRKLILARTVLVLTALNTVIALYLTYIDGSGGSFQINWVFSMFIGTSITLLVDSSRWLIWRFKKPNLIGFALICVTAAPIGYYFGHYVGTLIFPQAVSVQVAASNRGERAMVVMCIFLSLAFCFFFWNQNKLAELRAEAEREKARNAAIERQAMQAQLQLLQAQIEPHMLFNTLANLQGLIAIDPHRAQYMLEQLILYLRASLNSSRNDKTTLQQEFRLMHAYLELLAIRMGKRLSYDIVLPPELQGIEIAPMLLQPLVENAIKHGIEPKMAGGHIQVTASLEDTVLHVKVSDTGMGLPFDYREMPPAGDSASHVGNANVRERLRALYGTAARLNLSANQPEGVVAHLTIPLN